MLRKSCLQATALIISLILARAAAVAQPATLVKDINPGAGLQPNYSSHSDLVQSGSFAYFTSDAGGSGNELWRTDGTAAGTRLVADISPAILFGGNAYPSNLTDVNGTLFFTTREQSGPAILWKTDGSTTGTGVVVRLGPNEDLTDLTNVGGTLFFFKYVSGSVDLWKSDGTSVGTVLVRTGLKTPPYGPSFAVLNGILFFAADDGTSGVELWKSDGTPAGTVPVRDINPGPAASNPNGLASIGGTLFFSACEDTHGCEIWKSDGSGPGTAIVKDIAPGLASSNPSGFVSYGGAILFAATDGASGYELWRSDGTDTGTVLVRDIHPGTGSSFPVYLVAGPGGVYFSADDGVSGREPWRSDGTFAGTFQLGDLFSGPGPSSLGSFTVLGASVFFSAKDSQHLYELWTSDGTPAGTVPVKNVAIVSNIVNLQGLLLFFGSNSDTFSANLWKSDGTTSGTTEYFRFDTPPGSSPTILAASGTEVVFTAFTTVDGVQVWKSDGTSPGTEQISNAESPSYPYAGGALTVGGRTFVSADGFLWVTPGASTLFERLTSQPAFIGNLCDLGGGTLLFQDGAALWRSDGTPAGTQFVHALPDSGVMSAAPVPAGTFAYFVLGNLGPNQELWKSDGTPGGTGLVKVLGNIDYASGLTAFNGLLYFSISAFPGGSIWSSDGTETGTQPVIPLYGTSFTIIGSTLYFAAGHPMTGVELWKTDGTLNGTHLVSDIQPGTQSSTPQQLVAIGSELYFVADDGVHGQELWRSDGSDAGTSMVLDIRPGADSPNIQGLTSSGGVLFFVASDLANGTELWKSDGTPGGTVIVKDINPGAASSSPTSLTDAGGVLYFAAFDPLAGRELWKSDGTPSGTVLVRDVEPGLNGSAPHGGVEVGGLLFFAANTEANGIELWKSDGTPAGTNLVKDLIPGPFSGNPGALVALGNRLVFSATDEAHGAELWASDGFDAGTTLLRDINPGTISSSPGPTANLGNRVFFGADDGAHGRELWVTDGTTAGTSLFADLAPGTASGNPQSFIVNGPFLFFTGPPPVGSTAPFGLWRTDGTVPGTIVLAAIQSSPPVRLGAFVYFQVMNGSVAELWKSDGTPGGTQFAAPFPIGGGYFISSGPFLYYWVFSGSGGLELRRTDGTATGVLTLKSGFLGNSPAFFTDVGGVLFFAGDDGVHGTELWKSNGSVTGTVLVKDIWTGPLGSGITGMTNVGGTLVFSANDGVHGSELWMSDGTFAGTVQVQDINPGLPSSRPSPVALGAIVGDRLFLSATDSSTGNELWSMPISSVCAAPAPPVIQSTRNPSCGDAVILDAGPGYASYLWSTGDTTRTIQVAPGVTTSYTVYTGNAKGCRSSATIVQAVDPALVPSPPTVSNNGPLCVGEALQLTASSVPGATYSWTGPNGFTSSMRNPSIPSATLAASGSYHVTVTVNGCTSAPATTSVSVTAVPFVPVVHSSGVLCVGETLQLTASTVPGATYAWTGPNSFTSALQNPTIASAIAADSGAYSVTVTVNGCTSPAATTSVSVTACQVRPVALSSDGSGNGILEPGETAVVAPSWLNTTGSAVALTGTATAFTGPAGATYSLVDAAANYGSVAPGATAGCISTGDCYAVGVSNPGTRPLLHWDAVFSEALSTGDAKSWNIHIGDSFADVATNSPYYRFVETLLHNGVTTGCGAGAYCPAASVTRAQMAVFLLVSQAGTAFTPPPATGFFLDVPATNSFARWIEELARRGVTAGCGNGDFCPNANVTRAQMAVFLLVTREGAAYVPPPATGLFNDVPAGSAFAPWIEELFHRGIAAGCGNGDYCPASPVSRAQMAVLLTTTFGLSIGAP